MQNKIKKLSIILGSLVLIVSAVGVGTASAALTFDATSAVSTGILTLTGVGTGTTSATAGIGLTANTTSTIVIGGPVQTGAINIADPASTAVSTINIGTNAKANVITIGSTTDAATLNLKAGSGGVVVTGVLTAASPTFATSITGSYLTASEMLGTGASGNIVSLAVATYPSLTELTYVKGVTSALQTQIAGLVPYTGATGNVDLGSQGLYVQTIMTSASDMAFWPKGAGTKVGIYNASASAGANFDVDSLTVDRTFAFPDASGTLALGTGTINELAYWSGANTLGTLAVATYPSLTELSYVKGVSGAIQTQFTGKAATNQTMYIGTTAVNIDRASAALTLAGITLTTPNLGTPTALTLTSATGLPAAAVLAGSLGTGAYVMDSSLQVSTIELGHVTDTTLSRVSAGLVAIEGLNVVDVSTAQTLANKTLTAPVLGVATATSVTANAYNVTNGAAFTASAAPTKANLQAASFWPVTMPAGVLDIDIPAMDAADVGRHLTFAVTTATANAFTVTAGAGMTVTTILNIAAIVAGDDVGDYIDCLITGTATATCVTYALD